MEKTSQIIVQMKEDVGYMRGRIDEILGVLERIPTTYATKEEVNLKLDKVNTRISPLERVVYGLIGVILTAVLLALISLVIGKNPQILS